MGRHPLNLPLFVYAELKNPHKPDDRSARGTLRLRPDGDGAAQFYPGTTRLVFGQLLSPERDSAKLAKAEKPEFRRRRIVLTDGTLCEAFEYIKRDFEELPLVPSGRWPPEKKQK